MKRLLCIVTIIFLLLSLFACVNDKNQTSNNDGSGGGGGSSWGDDDNPENGTSGENNSENENNPEEDHHHTPGEWIIDEEPDCETTGSKHTECTECNETVETVTISAEGHDFEDDGTTCKHCGKKASNDLEYLSNGDGTCSVVGIGGCTDKHIIIPKTHDGMKVVSINEGAFYGNTDITGIVVSDSVTSINRDAFYECTDLALIILSNNLEEIETSAFYGCSSLAELYLPSSLTSLGGFYGFRGAFDSCTKLRKVTFEEDNTKEPTTHIGIKAFANCTSLSEVYIGRNVKAVEDSAFENCHSLSSLTIQNNVESIGHSAFKNCSSLKSINLPDSVTIIEESAFYNCTALYLIEFGKIITEIGHSAFYNCTSIEEVFFPSSLTSLNGFYGFYGAFENCTNLRKVTFEESDTKEHSTYIGIKAFANCTSLTEIKISNQVETIGENAFCGCSGLFSVTIPSSVLTIEQNAFINCTSLEYVLINHGEESDRIFQSKVFINCSKLDRIYYTGTAEDWAMIEIWDENFPLCETPYYYSENQPTEAGNYWYYNENGQPRVWDATEDIFRAEEYSENFYDIFGGQESSYASLFYDQIHNDHSLMAGIQLWETLHIAAEPSYIFDPQNSLISKIDLYTLVLMDALTGENAEGASLDFFNSASYSFIMDAGNRIIDLPGGIEPQKLISILSESDANLAVKFLDKFYTKTHLNDLKRIATLAENAYEALEACSRYEALRQVNERYIEVLIAISEDDSNPNDLQIAASRLASWYEKAYTTSLTGFAFETFLYSTGYDILMGYVNKTIDVGLEAIPILKEINFIAKGIRAFAEPLQIDKFCQAYYKLKISVAIENSLRKIIQVENGDYLRESMYDEAMFYLCAVDLYKKSVINGFDYSIELLTAYMNSAGANEENFPIYQDNVNQLNYSKQEKINIYNRLDNIIIEAYEDQYLI